MAAVAEQENVDPAKLSANVRKPVGPRKPGAAVSAPQTQKPLPVKKYNSSVDLELAEIEKKRREAKELAEKNSCRMKKKCAVAADGVVLQADSQSTTTSCTKAEGTVPVSKEAVKRSDSVRALRPRSSPPNNRTKPENTLRERTSVVQLAVTTTKTRERSSSLNHRVKSGSTTPASTESVQPDVATVVRTSPRACTKPEGPVTTAGSSAVPSHRRTKAEGTTTANGSTAPQASTAGSRTSPRQTGTKPGSPLPASGSTVGPGVAQRASVRSASLNRRTKPECTVATSVETAQPDSTNSACSAATESGPADHPGRTVSRTSPSMSRVKSEVMAPSTKPKAAASGKKGLSSADLEMAEIEKKRREAKELAERNLSRMKRAAPTDDQPVPAPVFADSQSGAVAPVNTKAKCNESKEVPQKTPRQLPVRSAAVGPREASPCKKSPGLATDLKTSVVASPAPLRRRASPSKSETSPSIVRRQSPSKPDVSTKRSVLSPDLRSPKKSPLAHMADPVVAVQGETPVAPSSICVAVEEEALKCSATSVGDLMHDEDEPPIAPLEKDEPPIATLENSPDDSRLFGISEGTQRTSTEEKVAAIPDEAQERSKVSDGDASTVDHSIADENKESLKVVELTSPLDAVDEKTEYLEDVHSSTVQDVRTESATFVEDVETVNQVGLRAEQDVLESAANQGVLEEQTVCFDDVGLTAEQDFLGDNAVCMQHVELTADQDEAKEQTRCFEDVASAVVNDVREEKVACVQHADTITNKDSVSEQTIVLEEIGSKAEQTVPEEVVDEKTVCVEDVEPVKEQYIGEDEIVGAGQGESTAAQDVDEKTICIEDAELTANRDESTGRVETNNSVDTLPWQRDRLDERKELFKLCDPNRNLFCSLAEIDAQLSQGTFDFGSRDVEYVNSCMLHAFNKAKDFGGDERGCSADYIEHREFRIFLEVFVKKLDNDDAIDDAELEDLKD